MKFALVVSLFAVSSAYAACPDISGLFSRCKSTSPMDAAVKAALITQSENSVRIATESANGTQMDEYTTDGVTRTTSVEVEGYKIDIDVTATCDATSLTVDTYIGEIDTRETDRYSLNSEKSLVIENYMDGDLFNTTICRSTDK